MTRLFLTSLLLLASACSTPQRLATVLNPGMKIDLELTGARPSLFIHNGGPGYLTIEACGAGFSSKDTMAPGTWRQKFAGPTRVELSATSEEPVRLSFRSNQGEALALEMVAER